MSVEVGSYRMLEPVIDALATPALALEPGTGRVLRANRAAATLAGGAFPAHEVFSRAAQGKRLEDVPVEWAHSTGRRSLLVSAAPFAGAVLVTLEDVTELERARRRAALLADAGANL